MILFHAIVVHHNPKHLSVGVGGGGDSFRLWPMMVTSPSRNVMVVVDPSPQSAAALQYALSHALVEQDKLILFYIENSTSWENAFSTFLRKSNNSSSSTPNIISEGPFGTDVDFLDQMRRACEIARPKINVKIEKTDMDGKDKASVILSKSKDLRIDLIVIGQKRSISSAILGIKRQNGSLKGGPKAIDTVDYLIENSPCSCVAVQKKGQNGGYVLNSKTHKNFCFLA